MIALVIASTLHTAFAIALYMAVIRHDPVKLYMFQLTGGLGEIGFPFILLPIVFVVGSIGGAIGKSLPGHRATAA